MNRKFRRDLFKRFKIKHPDAQATRCYQNFMYDFNDSGYACSTAFEVLKEESIKIYKIGECDWYAATSMKKAKECYIEQTGYTEDEFEEFASDHGCYKISEDAMDTLIFTDDDERDENGDRVERTFREELEKKISEGCKVPFLFASTEY